MSTKLKEGQADKAAKEKAGKKLLADQSEAMYDS